MPYGPLLDHLTRRGSVLRSVAGDAVLVPVQGAPVARLSGVEQGGPDA